MNTYKFIHEILKIQNREFSGQMAEHCILSDTLCPHCLAFLAESSSLDYSRVELKDYAYITALKDDVLRYNG